MSTVGTTNSDWLAGNGRFRFAKDEWGYPRLFDCGALWFWEWWEV
jgi:hypothetical protein